MKRALFLWSYISESRWALFFGLVLLTLVSATSLIYPWLLKLIVDKLLHPALPSWDTTWLAFGLVCMLAISTLAGFRQQMMMQSIGFQLRNALRRDFYRKLLDEPMSFHRTQLLGELSARLSEDIGRVQTLPAGLLAPLFQNTLFVFGCILLMAALNVYATLVVIPLLLLPLPVIFYTSRSIRSSSGRSQSIHARASAFFEETLAAIREVKAMGGERRALERYDAILADAHQSELSSSRQHVFVNQFVYFLLSSLLLGIFYLGSSHAFFQEWSIGSVIAFYFYAYTLSMALISQARIIVSHQNVFGAIDRVTEFLSAERSTPAAVGSHAAPIRGEVKFDHVSFEYTPERPVLRQISFECLPGTWSVISGPSGSGKSTLATLLLGLDQPLDGRVLLDGVGVGDWDPAALHQQIGFAGQEPVLFHGTLRENIGISSPDMGPERLAGLLWTCCLETFIASLPEGLNTVVGERGYALSGGQRARIALARALASSPPLLLLDEINAAFEPELEREVWARLAQERSGLSTVIFTHHADLIPPECVKARISLPPSPV